MKDWYYPIKHVRQGDENGCAIACIAIIAGLTYERARAETFPKRRTFRDNKSLHVDDDRMSSTFRRLGFHVNHSATFRDHKRPAVLVFEWEPGMPSSDRHAVVWDPFSERFLDPGYGPNFHNTDRYLTLWQKTGYRATIVTGMWR